MAKISIASWNVNGIRAAAKKGFIEWVEAGKYDIVCLQETKVSDESQLSEKMHHPDGYKYSYWAHHKIHKGRSGVAAIIPPRTLDRTARMGGQRQQCLQTVGGRSHTPR